MRGEALKTIYSLSVPPWGLAGKRFGPDFMECPVIDIDTRELILEVCAASTEAGEIARLSIDRGDDNVARVNCNVPTFAYLVRKDDKVYEVRGDISTWTAWESLTAMERW